MSSATARGEVAASKKTDAGHAFMYVAGLRFDTVALTETGDRWSARPADESDLSSFAVRRAVDARDGAVFDLMPYTHEIEQGCLGAPDPGGRYW